MRKVTLILGAGLALLSLGACGRSGLNRVKPDEFAVARQAPLVVPPDYSLQPPQPGAPRPQESTPSAQALDALFGGPAPRSQTETSTLQSAGANVAEAGIRSGVGDPATQVVDKGTVTRDIIAAPQGDGQAARVSAGGGQ